MNRKARRSVAAIALGVVLAAASASVIAADLDSPKRHELKRTDLSGAPGMEVVESVTEYKPGDSIPAHIHHGVEGGYVIQGATAKTATGQAIELKTGDPILNLRDVKHGGFTVTGDQSLKLFTVHIVDKGKPLYDEPPQ